MAVPTTTVRIDWENAGTFVAVPTLDTVVPTGGLISRGANGDYGEEAFGTCVLTFKNDNEFFTPDRNWADGGSFEAGVSGWQTYAVASLTAAATSITQVTDNAPSAGAKAGEAVLTATSQSGVHYPLPYRFRSGVVYSISFYLKSTAGTTTIQCGIASSGSAADLATAGGTITTSWAVYSTTWTPSADRTDAVLFVRTNTTATATVRIDRIQLNPGAALNTYIEAPTKGQLVPGRPVHAYGTSGTDRAKFYGFIERIEPDPRNRTVAITCYDPLRKMAETDIIVAPLAAARTGRETRIAILEDFERGARNLLANPRFATATTHWTATGGTLTRSATGGPDGISATYAEWVPTSSAHLLKNHARLAPRGYNGQVYRFSIYARTASGSSSWVMELATAAALTSKTISVTTTWTQFTVTAALTADVSMSSQPLVAQLYSSAAGGGTIRVTAAQVTRGVARHPYADEGTGRLPNFCGNGSFDGQSLSGYVNGFANLLTNPSFEVDTSTWDTAADAFHDAGATIARVAASAKYGTARGSLACPALADGVHVAITGTFLTGQTYDCGIWVKDDGGGGTGIEVGIGSQGTPADTASNSAASLSATYQLISFSWAPSANRTDAHFYVENRDPSGRTFEIDGAFIYRRHSTANLNYSDTGPGGGGSFLSTTAFSSSVVKWGSHSFALTTPATATAGLLYDFNHLGAYFTAGVTYSVSVWIRATTAMPYRIGIGGWAGDGTWDDNDATGTLVSDTWTEVTTTWTPAADYSTASAWQVVLYVYGTDAVARSFFLDGIRVIPASAADDYEMDQWDLDASSSAEATDVYLAAAGIAETSALSALQAINDLTLTRHFIRPTMAAPWYQYVTEDRATYQAKSSQATISGSDIINDPVFEIDRQSVINTVGVEWDDNTDYYSDDDSVGIYGVRPGAIIGGSTFFPDRTIPDSLGPLAAARRAEARARPQITITNDAPNQLDLEPNEVIAITSTKALLTTEEYVIVGEELVIAPQSWVTTYRTERYPY